MKKGKAIVLGILTLLPIAYMVFFFSFIISTMLKTIYDTDVGNLTNMIKIIFPLHFAMMILLIVLLVVYITDVFKNKTIEQDKRTLWAIVLFFGNIIAMVIYWIIHIWKPLLDKKE